MLPIDELKAALYRANRDDIIYATDRWTFIEAMEELVEALEDAVTGCSNPRQAPGTVLAKYKEALDD